MLPAMFGRKTQTAKAKILSDEGYHMAENSGTVALQHEKYIVEVHPEGAPPFRTETVAWVSWTDRPAVGDIMDVRYAPGSQHVDLVIEGDPRYDWRLIAAQKDAADQQQRRNLLD